MYKRQELLRRLRDRSNEKNLKEMAQKQLAEQLAIAAKIPIGTPEDLAAAKAALAELGDEQRALEDVAKGAKSLEIRKGAFPRLVHAGAIHAVALSEEDEGLAMQAFAKVTKEAYLESLARSAKVKAVRVAAKEKLKSASASKGMDQAAVNRAKLALVLSVAEKAAAPD